MPEDTDERRLGYASLLVEQHGLLKDMESLGCSPELMQRAVAQRLSLARHYANHLGETANTTEQIEDLVVRAQAEVDDSPTVAEEWIVKMHGRKEQDDESR